MNPVEAAQSQPWYRIYLNPISSLFWCLQIVAVVGVIMLGFSWSGLAWALGLYFARMFAVTGILHRYFSHRTYKTSRVMQFILGVLSTTTLQKGPLWWAHHHRHHHRRSDQSDDLHSPEQGGFWWSHMGWFLAEDFEPTNYDKIKDFAKYPEMVWLNRYWLIFAFGQGVALWVFGGLEVMIWGYAVSMTLLWHGTFTINSLAHLIGTRRYETTDDSRNHWFLAVITMGEGWHNNHHRYQSSCRQGFRWYEIDMTYYIIRLMAAVGLVWDVREPPRYIVENRSKFEGGEIDAETPVASASHDPEPITAPTPVSTSTPAADANLPVVLAVAVAEEPVPEIHI